MRKIGGKGPVRINTLFEVYKQKLRAPEGSVIQVAREVIEEVCGIILETKHLRYTPHTRTLVCKAPGPQKSEILMRHKEILTHMNGRLGVSSAPKTIL